MAAVPQAARHGRAAAIVERWWAARVAPSADAARLLVAGSPDELRALLIEIVGEVLAGKGVR